MMKILIVEDAAYRIAWFANKFGDTTKYQTFWAKSAEEATDHLLKHSFNIVFLDHDLSGRIFVDPSDPDSGSEVVRFITLNGVEIDLIVVHSHNECNSLRMVATLMESGYSVCRTAFKNLAHKQVKAKLIEDSI